MKHKGGTHYLEIEQKYKADQIDWDIFVRKLHKLAPFKRLRIKGPDTYFGKGKEVLRWRRSGDKNELTVKSRHSERSTFVRDETDLQINGNSAKTVIKWINALGYEKKFRIIKDCEIFWFASKLGNVSIVIYDVFFQLREAKDTTEGSSRRFIEIEAEKGQDYRLSKKLVRYWEKTLKLKKGWRINKSLYEIYSRKVKS